MNVVTSIVLNDFKNDSRVLKENISLQNAGYNVKVVALWEDGVKEFDIVQNIKVHRVKLKSKDWSKNKAIQFLKYFEFLYRVIKEYKNSDIIHCNDLNTLPIGVIIKKIFNKNTKVVYDAHEHETERAGFGRFEKFVSKVLEKNLIKYADAVITVSYSIADDYVKMYNIKKPALILNTPFYKDLEKQNIFREKFNIPKSNMIFLYQGGLAKNRGILEFAELINNKKEISYVIMGYGGLKEEILQFCQNSSNVYFHEAVSPDVLLNYTCSADIGVCIEKNICKSWDYALPNKMFEYILAGLPVLVGGLNEMITFVDKHKIGFICEDIYNKEGCSEKLNNIAKEYKFIIQNVNKKAKEFNWQEQEKVLVKLYKELENA